MPASPPAPVPEIHPSFQPEPEPLAEDRSLLSHAPGVPAPDPTLAAAAGASAAAGTATATLTEEDGGTDKVASNADVVRSTGSMAIATLISRITGFLRNALIGASLGEMVASAFNIANTLPNLITEIVLGAVLTSLVVPVLVRAEKEDADHGAAFIRRLFTLAVTLLVIVTAVSLLATPLITRVMLGEDSEVNVVQSTSFAYLLLPQIFFYGIFSLFMAVLNTKGIFKPGAWAPVANNVISVAVLLLYMLIPGRLGDDAQSSVTDPHVMLLGLGTTLGVIVQSLIMIRPLRRAGIDLRPLWGIDDRLKQFGGMALAIIVYVGISQAGWMVTTHIAGQADGAAPNIYQQAWLLLQVPYGIIGVTLLTALMPRISRNAADGDDKAVVADLTLATKLTFIALIPVIIFFMAFGPEIGVALFAYLNFPLETARLLGLTLSFSAFTLIPYALVLLHLRVFYAREEAWTPTFIIAGITATKVVLSLASPLVAASPERVVILLGAANGFGFVAGAFIGAFLLRRKLGPLGFRSIMKTTGWAVAASIIGAAVALFVHFLLGLVTPALPSPFSSFAEMIKVGIVGVIFLIVTGIALSFSRLPEVQNLGAVLQRIPGMRRFIKPDTSRQFDVAVPTQEELSTQLLGTDAFNATPVPPPLSAGVVRGPRLVPGAPVADGRFRLLADHGSVPGARFWQARERSTGRTVGLVFVDTTGSAPLAPASPAKAAGAAAEVVRRTRKLDSLEHPAIAPVLDVSAYRSGCLVVTEWVPGSSLHAVAEAGADPYAASYALSGLTDAAAAARDAFTPLGLDNHARIRINTAGEAVLAFPAVLSEASYANDSASLGSALIRLINPDTAPDSVVDVRDKVCRTAEFEKREEQDLPAPEDEDDAEVEPMDVRELAARLKEVGLAGDTGSSAALMVDKEPAPQPTERAGFGSKSYSRKMIATIAVTVILVVSVIGALMAYVTGLLSGDNEGAPINEESIQGVQTAVPGSLPLVQDLAGVSGWPQPVAGQLDQLIDDDEATSWTAPVTAGQFPGVGVRLSTEHLVELQKIVVLGDSQGAEISVHALPVGTDATTLTSLDDAPAVATGTLGEQRTSIDVADPVNTEEVIVWFASPPSDSTSLDIAEIRLVGAPATVPSSGEPEPTAVPTP